MALAISKAFIAHEVCTIDLGLRVKGCSGIPFVSESVWETLGSCCCVDVKRRKVEEWNAFVGDRTATSRFYVT